MFGLAPMKKKHVARANGNGNSFFSPGDFPTVIDRMRNEMDRLLERFYDEWPIAAPEAEKSWRWGLEVKDQPSALVIEAEAPGFEAGDLDIEVRGKQLIMAGCKK